MYYAQRNLQDKEQSITKLLRGEFPTHILFLAWLYYYKVPYFLHYIPIILNSTGKVYWLLKEKNIEIVTVVQQLIIFQSQCEAFVSFNLFLSACTLNYEKILQFLTYVLILKIKYRFYAPAHKAYNEVHFFFDRISRYFKFRSFYHFVYRAISCFSNDAYSPPLTW